MVGKTSILQNLNAIEGLYNKSKSLRNTLFFSKLAILELCGWIEESMDDIVRRIANRKLHDKINRSSVEKKIIKRVHGFDYNDHFRTMLVQVIGLISLERIERKIDSKKLEVMQATLDTLKTIRNLEAHTHIKGATKILDAPSVTKKRFIDVYVGLKDLETELKLL